MSRHTLKTAILFLGVGALVVVTQYQDWSKELSIRATTSSSLVHLRRTDKVRGPLETSVELEGSAPEKAGDVFSLRGKIHSDAQLENVDFEWAIPKGVEIVNGSRTGRLAAVSPDQPAEVQITLRSLDLTNHQIHFVTNGRRNGAAFAESVQFNTLLQQLLKDSKEALLKSTALEASKPEVKQKNLKVFH